MTKTALIFTFVILFFIFISIASTAIAAVMVIKEMNKRIHKNK